MRKLKIRKKMMIDEIYDALKEIKMDLMKKNTLPASILANIGGWKKL